MENILSTIIKKILQKDTIFVILSLLFVLESAFFFLTFLLNKFKKTSCYLKKQIMFYFSRLSLNAFITKKKKNNMHK